MSKLVGLIPHATIFIINVFVDYFIIKLIAIITLMPITVYSE